MKKNMNTLINGNIKYEKDKPLISHEALTGTVGVHENYRGSFFIEASSNVQLNGVLYCTNARIGFRPSQFSGYHENFVFEADTRGLLPGDKITGEFILHTTQGEYRIPIAITVEEIGNRDQNQLITKEAFVQQAREDFSAAYQTFLSREFQRALTVWGEHYVNLYRGIREHQVNYMSLEQFLVGAGLKEPVKLSLENDTLELNNVEESVQEGFILTKENWGFSSFRVRSDADFIKIVHPEASTEEFIGNRYTIHFVVDRAFLHAGCNLACITIQNGYKEMKAYVKIHNDQRFLPENDLHKRRLELMQMISVYIDYQTEKIGETEWIGITENTIDNYHKSGGNHIFYDLYEAYLAVRKDNREKALQMLSRISERKEELKDPAMYGIYLVLTKHLNPNDNYQEWVKEHLQTIYLENQENWIIQLLMFYVNPETIRNDTVKLDLIRRQFISGCHSPVLYLEAYKILKKEPLMLRNLESFEVHLLQFICREHLLDREISGQTAQIAARMQGFHPLLFRILCKCFDTFPTRNMLTAICNMLITGKKHSREYAKWFALGIKQDVRITGLYEYYVETSEDMEEMMLPSAVKMYFIYHNTLDYAKKAAIYANIVKNREEDLEGYDTYRPSMERFAEEQVERGHINQDLAVLYKDLLAGELLTPSLAAGLEKILFMYRIEVKNPKIRQILVFHEETSFEQRIQVTNGECYVQLFSPDAVLLMEDMEGCRYPLSDDMVPCRMLEDKRLEDACRVKLRMPAAIRIHDCSQSGSRIEVTEENVNAYTQILRVPNIKDKYSSAVRVALMDYYLEHKKAGDFDDFMEQEEAREILVDKIPVWAELLAYKEHYQKIMDIVRVYGMEKVDPDILLRTCNYCILKQNYAKDEMLLAVCAYCYEHGKYDTVMLRFLIRYYEGSIEEMKSLWRKGKEQGIESVDLESRILGAIVFTEDHLDETEPIFDSYQKAGGSPGIVKPYVILMANEYFAHEKDVQACVFAYIESHMMGNGAPDICRLALMEFLTYSQERTETQTMLLKKMVEHYQNLGMRFAFFMDLPEKLKEALNIHDKYIVEYRCSPNSDVILRYCMNGAKESAQLMQEVYRGVYVKEFTVFYGDTLEWTFQRKDVSELSEKYELIYKPEDLLQGNTRYHLINRMIAAKDAKEKQKYRELVEQYAKQQHLVETLFPLP